MPPWHATHGYGEFADERRLTDAQIAAIGQWVKEGMPEGDRDRMPKLHQFTDGWQLGKPDLILEMPASFSVPASGPDLYRNFAIPTGMAEDKWIRAVEFRPSARKAVHHALFSQPVMLPKGARIDVRIQYDNSADNPRNPNQPPKRVRWGEESFSEMGAVSLIAMPVRTGDESVLRDLFNQRTTAAINRGVQDGTATRFLGSEILSQAAVAGPRRSQIALFDRDGKPVASVGEPGNYTQPALSPDGKQVAVTRTDAGTRNADIWVFDVLSGKAAPFTSGPTTNSSPIWSPASS